MSGELTLAALLAHPENGGLRLVAGPAAGEWDRVHICADIAELPAECERSLTILTSSLPRAPWRQDALIRQLHDRGVAALAVPRADEVDAGARHLAQRLDFALLDTTQPIELARACWQLQQARDALTLSYVRRIAHAFEYPADDLADLLRHLTANLGHGIALVDATGVLHEAGGSLDPELHAGIDFSPWISLAHTDSASVASVRVDSPSRTGLRLAVFDSGIGAPQLQALAVVAEIMAPAVAARIMIDELAEVSDASVSSGLLRDFVDLRGTHDAEIERRMAERGWRTSGYHLGFHIIGRSRIDALDLLRVTTRELGGIAVDSHATTRGRGVSGWLSFAGQLSPHESERHVGALRQMHTALRRSFNVAIGIGSLQSGSIGLTSTLSEAADAASLAVNRSATGYFMRVDGLGFEQLLLAWTSNDTFLPAAESLLAPLREDSAELLETLAVYLDNESVVQATAQAMGVHRNTVAARVQRAQELLGVDFSASETRLALHLACRAVRG